MLTTAATPAQHLGWLLWVRKLAKADQVLHVTPQVAKLREEHLHGEQVPVAAPQRDMKCPRRCIPQAKHAVFEELAVFICRHVLLQSLTLDTLLRIHRQKRGGLGGVIGDAQLCVHFDNHVTNQVEQISHRRHLAAQHHRLYDELCLRPSKDGAPSCESNGRDARAHLQKHETLPIERFMVVASPCHCIAMNRHAAHDDVSQNHHRQLPIRHADDIAWGLAQTSPEQAPNRPVRFVCVAGDTATYYHVPHAENTGANHLWSQRAQQAHQ
mmetsp:Transcript_120450/g.384585  ORF Transcript_120450/g.384585 Transcript_120450/m.384585 type:complete len:269 (-) Transcript_120450:496-1302(-)